MHEVGKSWIVAKRIGQWFSWQVHQIFAPFIEGFIEPAEGFILIVEPSVNQRNINAWYVSRDAHLLELGNNGASFHFSRRTLSSAP
jgi:hypothetical protein